MSAISRGLHARAKFTLALFLFPKAICCATNRLRSSKKLSLQYISIELDITRTLDIWEKDSLEQARCLFHNNYARDLFCNFADRSSSVLEAILNFRRQVQAVENFTFKIVQCHSHHLTIAINFNRTKELKTFCRR
jgi:hypothetical protein